MSATPTPCYQHHSHAIITTTTMVNTNTTMHHHHHLAGLGQQDQVAPAGLPVLGDHVEVGELLAQVGGDGVAHEVQVVEAPHEEVEGLGEDDEMMR